MNLAPDMFEDAAIERMYHGAGVVPVARDAQGRVRVLLGRERFTQQE